MSKPREEDHLGVTGEPGARADVEEPVGCPPRGAGGKEQPGEGGDRGSGPRDFTSPAVFRPQHIHPPGAAPRSPHMRCLGREGERQEREASPNLGTNPEP